MVESLPRGMQYKCNQLNSKMVKLKIHQIIFAATDIVCDVLPQLGTRKMVAMIAGRVGYKSLSILPVESS